MATEFFRALGLDTADVEAERARLAGSVAVAGAERVEAGKGFPAVSVGYSPVAFVNAAMVNELRPGLTFGEFRGMPAWSFADLAAAPYGIRADGICAEVVVDGASFEVREFADMLKAVDHALDGRILSWRGQERLPMICTGNDLSRGNLRLYSGPDVLDTDLSFLRLVQPYWRDLARSVFPQPPTVGQLFSEHSYWLHPVGDMGGWRFSVGVDGAIDVLPEHQWGPSLPVTSALVTAYWDRSFSSVPVAGYCYLHCFGRDVRSVVQSDLGGWPCGSDVADHLVRYGPSGEALQVSIDYGDGGTLHVEPRFRGFGREFRLPADFSDLVKYLRADEVADKVVGARDDNSNCHNLGIGYLAVDYCKICSGILMPRYEYVGPDGVASTEQIKRYRDIIEGKAGVRPVLFSATSMDPLAEGATVDVRVGLGEATLVGVPKIEGKVIVRVVGDDLAVFVPHGVGFSVGSAALLPGVKSAIVFSTGSVNIALEGGDVDNLFVWSLDSIGRRKFMHMHMHEDATDTFFRFYNKVGCRFGVFGVGAQRSLEVVYEKQIRDKVGWECPADKSSVDGGAGSDDDDWNGYQQYKAFGGQVLPGGLYGTALTAVDKSDMLVLFKRFGFEGGVCVGVGRYTQYIETLLGSGCLSYIIGTDDYMLDDGGPSDDEGFFDEV